MFFSPELCKLESSNMIYICRMSDCIVGLRLRVIWLYFSIFIHLYYMLTLIKRFYVGVFSGTFKARMLKLGLHMDNDLLYCGIENRTPCLSRFLCLIHVFRMLKINVTIFFATY